MKVVHARHDVVVELKKLEDCSDEFFGLAQCDSRSKNLKELVFASRERMRNLSTADVKLDLVVYDIPNPTDDYDACDPGSNFAITIEKGGMVTVIAAASHGIEGSKSFLCIDSVYL